MSLTMRLCNETDNRRIRQKGKDGKMKHSWIFAPVDYSDVTKTYDDDHKFMAFEKGKNGGWKEVSVWVDEHTGIIRWTCMLIHLESGTGTYFNERVKEIIEERRPSLDCRCMQ